MISQTATMKQGVYMYFFSFSDCSIHRRNLSAVRGPEK